MRNLLNIDAIEMALRALRRLAKDLGKELEKTATGELGRVMKELNAATAERDESEEQIGSLESEIEQAEQEKEDLDKKLKKYRGIRELVERREALDEQIRQLELEMEGLRAGFENTWDEVQCCFALRKSMQCSHISINEDERRDTARDSLRIDRKASSRRNLYLWPGNLRTQRGTRQATGMAAKGD